MKAGATALIVSAMLATGCVTPAQRQEMLIAQQQERDRLIEQQQRTKELQERWIKEDMERQAKKEKAQAAAAELKQMVPCEYPIMTGLAIGYYTDWIDAKIDNPADIGLRLKDDPLVCYVTRAIAGYCKGYYWSTGEKVLLSREIKDTTVNYEDGQKLAEVIANVDLTSGRHPMYLITAIDNLRCRQQNTAPPQPTTPSTPSPAPAQ